MALPKRKISKSRRDKRRTHQKIEAPNLATCAECNEPILPHHACPNCGAYKGRTAIETDKD
ncbi:MAG: 50S ribosomal protein L32 [Desulfobacteraceae bacterium]|nr:50S ribosomal protein L32 [Desulfobacteraceae bacterium]